MRDEFYKDAVAAEAAGGENAYAAMAKEAAAVPAWKQRGLVMPAVFCGRAARR